MEAAVLFFSCAVALVNGQLLNPYQWGNTNHMWTTGQGSGWRTQGQMYPGQMMQQGVVSSGMYPMWRAHPLFRTANGAATAKTSGLLETVLGLPEGVINIPKIPGQEILSHMILHDPKPKAYYDTISDMLYNHDVQKARQAVVPAVYRVQDPMYGASIVRANNMYTDDCGPQDPRYMDDFVY